MPALNNGDLILLDTGDAVRLLSTDYRSMIVRYSDGRAASAPISAYRGLLQPAGYDLDETQEMPAVNVEGN